MPAKKLILEKIKQVKTLPFPSKLLTCKFDRLTYNLLPLTHESVKDKNVVKLLARWRKKHEFWFQSQFKVTDKGTKIWLQKKVIDTPDRILFLIKADGKYIGHVGFFRFNFKDLTCEIDNVVRGELHYPGIIGNALEHLMAWGKKKLFLNSYTLETTSDNQRAIKLYTRLGFVEDKRIPLIYVKRKDFSEWIKAAKDHKKEIKSG